MREALIDWAYLGETLSFGKWVCMGFDFGR